MRVFDLHCDTIGECYNKNYGLFSNELHVSLEKARCFDVYTQVFAIWLDDTLRGQEAVAYFNAVADCYYDELEKNKGRIMPYPGEGAVNAILSAEGGSATGGSIEGLIELYERGVRLMTLTWNAENEIASGAFSEGGLKPFGVEAVKKMKELNMVIDVSHLNRQSFWDVARAADGAFVASHSNLDLSDNFAARARNLTNEQAKEIIGRGGLIGINFCRDFIETESDRGFEAVYRQIYEMSLLGGEKCIALGSDFDGCTMAPELSGVEKLPQLHEYLISRGAKPQMLDDVFYGNAERFFSKIK